jgi:hypothetical protein
MTTPDDDGAWILQFEDHDGHRCELQGEPDDRDNTEELYVVFDERCIAHRSRDNRWTIHDVGAMKYVLANFHQLMGWFGDVLGLPADLTAAPYH